MRTDPGDLRWNAGAWLGCQLGSTVWMLVAAATLQWQEQGPGAASAIVLGLFVAANLAGYLIWRQRNTWSWHRGVQTLLGCIAACGLLTIHVLDNSGAWAAWGGSRPGVGMSASGAYALLLTICFGLAVLFYFRFGR